MNESPSASAGPSDEIMADRLRRIFELNELSRRLAVAKLATERPGLTEAAYNAIYRRRIHAAKEAERRDARRGV